MGKARFSSGIRCFRGYRPGRRTCLSCHRQSLKSSGSCGHCYNRFHRKRNRLGLLMRSGPHTIQLDKPIVTTSMPQTPSRLASQSGVKKRLGSKASLRACSARIPSDQRLDSLKGSDHQTRDSEFSSEENLSSEIVTTSMPLSPSSIAKQLPSISKKRKRESLDKKKKKTKKYLKRKAESTT